MANENALFFSDQNGNPMKYSAGQNGLWVFFPFKLFFFFLNLFLKKEM